MEQRVVLRRRIEVAEELRSVTATMKSLAAVSVHQYERSALAVHECLRGVELGLQIVLRAEPWLARRRPPALDGRQRAASCSYIRAPAPAGASTTRRSWTSCRATRPGSGPGRRPVADAAAPDVPW